VVYDQQVDFSHAPKITQKDRQIQWDSSRAATDTARRYRALGRLWTEVYDAGHQKKRISCEGIEEVDLEETLQTRNATMTPDGLVRVCHYGESLSPEKDLAYFEAGDAIIVAIPRQDNVGLRIEAITVEGMARKSARKALQGLGLRSSDNSGT